MSTEAALAARQRGTEAALVRVRDAITRLRREKTQVSVAAVSRRADVSRTFLYSNTDARAAVAAAIAQAGEHRTRILDAQDDKREATWRERALNAEDALKAAHAEILTQRTRIGELLGQVRDLQSEWTQENIQRITTENTTLKQRVRTLTADNRTLEERLQAARSNNRFATAASPSWRPNSPALNGSRDAVRPARRRRRHRACRAARVPRRLAGIRPRQPHRVPGPVHRQHCLRPRLAARGLRPVQVPPRLHRRRGPVHPRRAVITRLPGRPGPASPGRVSSRPWRTMPT